MVTLPESDYKLTYSADTKIFAGTASVEIAPSDSNSNFKTGTTKRLTYTIAQCNLTSTKITASIDRELFDYTGAEIALPTESVVYHSASKTDHTLKKGTGGMFTDNGKRHRNLHDDDYRKRQLYRRCYQDV